MSVFVEAGYWGAALGLALFLAVFVATLVWMYRPGASTEYARSAAMPLDDGTVPAREARQAILGDTRSQTQRSA